LQEVAEASVGDPAPMGLFGFAVGTLLVAIPIAGIMPLTNVSAALPTLLIFAGLAQFIAGLVNDVALYNQRIMGPAHVVNVLDYAARTALTQRGPAHIAFPIDFQAAPADSGMRYMRNVPGHTSATYRPPIRVPQRQDLDAAAALFGDRHKIAILAGAGARGAVDELEAVADKLAAPIIKAQLGKDCVPDDSPYTTGPIAWSDRGPARKRSSSATPC
jgi:pyruvate dehydrogenase (quinone)/pyruvate oxidase